jgi:excinuclease ABC subunit C
VDLLQKIRTLPTQPGVYLYKNADGQVIYVGKAKSLRARVRNYFTDEAQADAKTGTLMREAVDIEYIVVANNGEALALENNLIKQHKPRYNILLRDDKTYPYVKLTLGERYPRVFVTRRLKKDGSEYYGPYFPANLAYRIVDLIHRHFLIPSCRIDLNRYHPRPCLQYYIGRCLGPCVKDLVANERYAEAVHDVKLFLEGRQTELARSLHARMVEAAEREQFELAAKYRDLISTVEQLQEKQRIAAAEGDDADVFGFHYSDGMLAVNLFHMRGGKIVDRREFFWDKIPGLEIGEQFSPGEFFSTLLTQLYVDQKYVPRYIYLPLDFEDRETLEQLLTEHYKTRIEIIIPQRGEKRSLIDLAGNNAKQSFDQRFRTMTPTAQIIEQAVQEALTLPERPRRVECFDISHIQGAETVASMVVWENGAMKKSDYRKFIIKTVEGVDDFASMREVVTRRYKRIMDEKGKMPSLILIDGGIGQLHAAAQALESIGITSQPLASIAKKEEIIYIYGQEDEPVVLDHHNPVLHLIQLIRDEAHRFAVTFHRKRRQIRDRANELLDIPGIGETAMKRLLEHFGSVKAVREADAAALSAVVNRGQVEAILSYFKAATAD